MIEHKKQLVTASDVEEYLKRNGKTRSWFHNVGARHDLLPPPIIKANHTYITKKVSKTLPERAQKQLKKLKGRTVYYPKQIKAYLRLIIRLKDIEGLSFEKIGKDKRVIRELNRLNYLVSTCLFVNPLYRGDGFFINFRVAKRMLLERYRVGADGLLSDVLGRIEEERRRDYSDYLQINEKIYNHALRYEAVDQELEKEKTRLAYSVSLSLKVMEATTAIMVERIKKKEISQLEWIKVANELEDEDRKAGIIK